MKKLKEHMNLIICLILMCVLTGVMFYYIDKKEGFHEDEIFSYTASNSKYSSIMLTYSKIDIADTILKTSNPFESLKNVVYYILIDSDLFEEKYVELEQEWSNSIWKTSEDAVEALTIDSGSEIMDFFTVYWNTARDVHPPLFYFLVHIVSCLFFGSFSKYIIFMINLAFFLLTCWYLRKIMYKIDKKNLAISLLILYGFSIGAISTVMFQRMYMMLTFFTVWFLYINLKIYYNDFKIDKSLKIELCVCTILGFLTQYYFCFYVIALALVMLIIMAVKKDKQDAKSYILQLIKSAVIGVVLFLPSIYHIFFSYRGAGGTAGSFTFMEKFEAFCNEIANAFSLSSAFALVVGLILFALLILQCTKKENRNLYLLLVIPTLLSFIGACALSPYRSLRYIMNLLPLIALAAICLIDSVITNKKVSFIIITILTCVLSIFGLTNGKVKYLYKGYSDYLDIAEEYKDDKFVLVCTTSFNYIVDLPEMEIYQSSLVVDPDNLEQLKDDEVLENEDEFILSIKNWTGDVDEILSDVMDYTGFVDYEMLLTKSSSADCTVFKLTK